MVMMEQVECVSQGNSHITSSTITVSVAVNPAGNNFMEVIDLIISKLKHSR